MAKKLSEAELARTFSDFDPPTEKTRLTPEDLRLVKTVLKDWRAKTSRAFSYRQRTLDEIDEEKFACSDFLKCLRQRGEMLKHVGEVLGKLEACGI